jgi:hypothetical protein
LLETIFSTVASSRHRYSGFARMPFQSAGPSIVRSIKQRDLLNTWLRLHSRFNGLPPVVDYHPARLEDELQDIVYYLVKRDGPRWQFIIDSHGSRLSQAYGSVGTNNVGKDLRDYVGPRMVDFVLPIYEVCAERALPVYSVSLIDDMNGRTVAYERLLLPFSSAGAVTHIVASLKTISDDGKFEINNLLRNPDKLPEYKVRAVIDRELALGMTGRDARQPARELSAATTGDIIEI